MKLLRAALLLSCSLAAVAWADPTADTWKAKCKSCHGIGGKADTKEGKKEKVNDMTVATWQSEWTDAKMKTMISEGSKDNKKMKPFKEKLSSAEIDGLIKHIRGFKP